MRHGSLFSGIGGFDLAAEWMGWENVFHCEWNPFGQRVLHHYWPKAESLTDITKISHLLTVPSVPKSQISHFPGSPIFVCAVMVS